MKNKIQWFIWGGLIVFGIQWGWQSLEFPSWVRTAKAANQNCIANTSTSYQELVEWANVNYEEDYEVVGSNAFYSMKRNTELYYAMMCIPQ